MMAVIQYTLKEHIRHRVYLTVILFGLILLGSGMVISSLAVEEQLRMMINVGLGGIEFLALIAIIFVTVNLVLEEVESRSIYLVLSHPIERWQYIVGRYLGTVLALTLGILMMGALHVSSLFIHSWTWQSFYPVAIVCSIGKIAVVGSLALLISLITTSTASSMTLTGFLWVMGHFSSELGYMADRSANPLVKTAIWVFQHVSPNFSYFNFRDFWQATQTPPAAWFGWMFIYSVSYVIAALALTSWLFSRKEV